MIDDLLFDMLYDNSFEMIFWNYFHFPQKRIVLTVLLRSLSFRVWVSTIYWKIFYDSRFEMIYDFHFEMSKGVLLTFWNALWLSFWNEGDKIFVHKIIFVRKNLDILLTKMPRRSGAKITSQLDNLRIPYNRKYLPAKSVAFQLLLKECKYMYGTYCWYHR